MWGVKTFNKILLAIKCFDVLLKIVMASSLPLKIFYNPMNYKLLLIVYKRFIASL